MKKLIVSMTTWSPRIKYAIEAINSLLESKKASRYANNIDIKLIIAEDEFASIEALPKEYQDLHNSKEIEIIIDKGNMKAHKKILYVAEHYPNDYILVVDDDKYYGIDFLNIYYEDMIKYPNDVLVGRTHFCLIPYEENGERHIKSQIIGTSLIDMEHEKGEEIITNEKFASGLNGTLFPPNTFCDERFFDRKLINKICEQSDEDWCFMFCIINNSVIRRSSHEEREPKSLTYDEALCIRFGQNAYDKYYDDMIKYFPEFYDKLLERYTVLI